MFDDEIREDEPPWQTAIPCESWQTKWTLELSPRRIKVVKAPGGSLDWAAVVEASLDKEASGTTTAGS